MWFDSTKKTKSLGCSICFEKIIQRILLHLLLDLAIVEKSDIKVLTEEKAYFKIWLSIICLGIICRRQYIYIYIYWNSHLSTGYHTTSSLVQIILLESLIWRLRTECTYSVHLVLLLQINVQIRYLDTSPYYTKRSSEY